MGKVKQLTPRQEDRRVRILSAAREMVADHGYEGMVMSQVAERAGVSPTTLYNLYNTKDQLVMESLQDLLLDSARSVMRSSGGHGWEYIVETVRGGAEMTRESPAYSDAMLTALQRAKAGDELVRVLIEDGCEAFDHSLKVMQQQDQLVADADTWNISVALNGVYWSSFFMWNKGVLKLQHLEAAVISSVLGILIPHTTGETRESLEKIVQDVGL